MQKNVNIIGCGYIGKKVARQLLIKNIIPYGFVKNEISKQVCDQIGAVTTLFDLDCEMQIWEKHRIIFLKEVLLLIFQRHQQKVKLIHGC